MGFTKLAKDQSYNVLYEDLYLYVATDGNDANNGEELYPFLTIQRAIDVAATLDTNNYNIYITVGTGEYTISSPIRFRQLIGSGSLSIQGTGSANVTLTASNIICFLADKALATNYAISGVKIVSGASGQCIVASVPCYILYWDIDFGTALVHINAAGGSYISCGGNCKISGSAAYHIAASAATIAEAGITITITGTPAWTYAYAYAGNNGYVYAPGNTYSGSATGARFYVDRNGVIYTNNAGLTYFPGNSAGVFIAGGYYDNYQNVATAAGYLGFYGTAPIAQPAATDILATVLSNLGLRAAGRANRITSGFGVAYACYDYATDSHVQGAVNPAITATLPSGAIVLGGVVHVITGVTSGGAATLAIGTVAGSSATALLAATAKGTLVTDYKVNTVPVFTNATFLRLTADGAINFTIGAADLTAGKVEVWVLYVIQGG